MPLVPLPLPPTPTVPLSSRLPRDEYSPAPWLLRNLRRARRHWQQQGGEVNAAFACCLRSLRALQMRCTDQPVARALYSLAFSIDSRSLSRMDANVLKMMTSAKHRISSSVASLI